jgi:hypothetical protein
MRAKLARRNYMATLKRIGPGSAFKVGLVLYALLGVFIGIIVACVSLVAGSLGGLAAPGAPGVRMMGFGMGFGAIIFFPVFYGVIGGIFAAVGAVIYNVVAGWVGGLEVDIN